MTTSKTNRKPTVPSTEFSTIFDAGSVKAIKSDNRRSDAMIFVKVTDIVRVEGFNARVKTDAYKQRVRDLADSMLAEGFMTDRPITCFVRKNAEGDNEVVVVDGHTRMEAVDLAISEGAEIVDLPVIIKAKSASMADLTIDLVRANSGAPLTMFETAIVVKRLNGMEMDTSEIAKKLGFTVTHIDNLLILAAAPNPLVRMIIEDTVSASTVIETIKSHGNSKATEILKGAADKAKASGKKKGRVTPAQLPAKVFEKAVRTAAPKLLARARAIRFDPGFRHLTEENRLALDELLLTLKSDDADDQQSEETTAATGQLFGDALATDAPAGDIPESGQEASTEAADTGPDPLINDAVRIVTESGKVSISAIQRKLTIGYNRAARLVEAMELAGVVSAPGHAGDRTVIQAS